MGFRGVNLNGARLSLFLFALLFVPAMAHAAIVFTGNAEDDFPAEACLADGTAPDVGLPSAFGAGAVTGWDIAALCYSYDPANKTLYIGLQTQTGGSGSPVIFGDADNDGDPGGAGLTLQGLSGSDSGDLGGDEFVTLAIDFDQDGTPDLVAGVSAGEDLSGFSAVGGSVAPFNNLLLASMPGFYGAPLAGVSATLDFFPSAARPHLEFRVTGLNQVPGFSADDFHFYLTAGSLEDEGIAEDFFPSGATNKVMDGGYLTDADGDGVNDSLDPSTPGGGTGSVADPNTNVTPGAVSTAASASASSSPPVLGGDVDLSQGAVGLMGAGCSLLPGAANVMGFWWLILLAWFGIVPRVWGLNADHYRPSSDGQGFLNYESARVLKKGTTAFGLSQHLAHSPLGFGVAASGRSLDSVISYFYVWNVWAAEGVKENFDFGLNLPFSLVTQIEDLNSAVESNTSSVGDFRAQGKWQFLKEGLWLDGAALRVFVDFPTGNSDDFFGESGLTGGFEWIGEKRLGRHELGGHVGTLLRKNEKIVASGLTLLEVGPEMLWGAGWRWFFSPQKAWGTAAHIWGKTDFRGESTSPIEADFGLQKKGLKIPLEGLLGFGFGLNKGYGVPTYRIIFSLQYRIGSE